MSTTGRPGFVPAGLPDEAVAWWLGTFAGKTAGVRTGFATAGLTGMVDQVDALSSDMYARGESALRAQGVFDPLDER